MRFVPFVCSLFMIFSLTPVFPQQLLMDFSGGFKSGSGYWPGHWPPCQTERATIPGGRGVLTFDIHHNPLSNKDLALQMRVRTPNGFSEALNWGFTLANNIPFNRHTIVKTVKPEDHQPGEEYWETAQYEIDLNGPTEIQMLICPQSRCGGGVCSHPASASAVKIFYSPEGQNPGTSIGTVGGPDSEGYPDLSGEWFEGSDHRVQITQDGSRIRATCTYSQGTRQVSWTMEGTVTKDGKVTGRLRHTQGVASNAPGFEQDRELQISPDGKSLSGKATWPGGGHSLTWRRTSVPSPEPPDSSTPPPAPASGMKLRAESRKVKEGETVTLPVWLDQGSSIANMNFNVLYDSNVVQAGSALKGAVVPPRSLFEVNSSERGVVRVGLADSRDFSGSGTVVQIPFKALGQPGSRTQLRLQVTTISNAAGAKPSIATVDGAIEIVGSQGGVPGDANGNGILDAGDALDALKMSVRLIPVKSICDIDQDGQVTSTDARLILQKVVGKAN